jgi:DNA-binding beta-propeller fold protein YncE
LLFPGIQGTETVGVISSDFGSGGRFNVINSELLAVTPNSVNIHSDAVGVFSYDKVIIINRLGRDSIQILNPNLGFFTEAEFSVGSGSNPQDIAIVNSNKAYVSLYNRNYLLVIDPSTGGEIKRIDLSSYSETSSTGSGGIDNLPESSHLFIEGNSLYLLLQRLDRNDGSGFPAPNTNSYLLEIDILSDRVINIYPTPAPNPISKIYKVNIFSKPYIAMCLPARLGFLSKNDGGIGAFDLTEKKFRSGFLYSETTAGGDITDMVIKSPDIGYAFVLDKSLNKYIHKFNPTTGEKLGVIASYSSSSGNISGLAISSSGKLYIGDSNFSRPGVSIFDTNSGDRKLTPAPIDVGLRPFDIIVLE